MKRLIAFSVGVLAVTAAVRTEEDSQNLFQDFKQTYGRKYRDAVEEEVRFGCFKGNLELIDLRNAESTTATHGVNQFADLCPKEFRQTMMGATPPKNLTDVPNMYTKSQLVAGQMINWADKGAVTPIKNQGQCGSCWSFSSTGNMEGQWFLAGNTLIGLSEEELVQCSHHQTFGCKGGWMDDAWQWVIGNGGINSEANYPYTSGFGVTGVCKIPKTKTSVAHIKSHINLPKDEDQMATWVFSNGPLSIALDAETWQTYSGGILRNCRGMVLDHAVLIVGFDDNNSPPYWIIKNSWGSSWGENGYIRVQKGTDECGLKQIPCSSQV